MGKHETGVRLSSGKQKLDPAAVSTGHEYGYSSGARDSPLKDTLGLRETTIASPVEKSHREGAREHPNLGGSLTQICRWGGEAGLRSRPERCRR